MGYEFPCLLSGLLEKMYEWKNEYRSTIASLIKNNSKYKKRKKYKIMKTEKQK